MGKVAAAYNLMPEDPDFPIERIKRAIPGSLPDGVKMEQIEVKPLAFGLKVIEATFVMEDSEGIVTELEQSLRNIPGLKNVETLSISLI
jgi:elongation factor 1-beta